MICHNFSSFVEEIMNLSQAQNWEAAKQEWEFESVFRNQSTCLCGHPIIENCVIHNKYNNNTAIVGNHCVLKFMGVDSAKYHFGLKKILVDSYKSINKELLEFIHDKKVITYNEYRFLANTLKKRNLTQKQKDYRFNLNQKIIAFMKSKSCSHSEEVTQMENTQTEIPAWIQEERAQLGETPTGERLPTFKLVPGKVVSFTVKVSGEPFGEYRDQEKGVIKKIIPVYGKQDGVEGDYNLWLNVKNPLYKEMLDKLAQGVTKFFVSTSGSQDKTRYALVEME